MTTNARDEKWSNWIEWSGGVCPIKKGDRCCVRYRNGEERIDVPAQSEGGHLALGGYNTTDGFWNNEGHACDIIAYRYKIKEPVKCLDNAWDVTPEEDRAWAEKERSISITTDADAKPHELSGSIGKQMRYLDAKGEDWIDEFARTATVDEFRGAMRFTIGKYNRRAGKKDELVKEIEKMRDYCERWLEYESKFS